MYHWVLTSVTSVSCEWLLYGRNNFTSSNIGGDGFVENLTSSGWLIDPQMDHFMLRLGTLMICMYPCPKGLPERSLLSVNLSFPVSKSHLNYYERVYPFSTHNACHQVQHLRGYIHTYNDYNINIFHREWHWDWFRVLQVCTSTLYIYFPVDHTK
jgi:hypothetical protein